MARYRSGHNGAVLKTVGGDEPSVGSNPTRAAMPFHMLTLDCQVDESETNYAGRLSTGWRAVESKLFSSILERVGKLGPVVAAEKYPKTIGVKSCFIGDSSERRAFSSARTMVVQISLCLFRVCWSIRHYLGSNPRQVVIVYWSPSTYDNQNCIGDGMGNGSPDKWSDVRVINLILFDSGRAWCKTYQEELSTCLASDSKEGVSSNRKTTRGYREGAAL